MEFVAKNNADWSPELLYSKIPPWFAQVTTETITALFADDGPASPRRLSDLIANPQFPASARQTASMFVDIHESNRILNLLISDRGRFFITLFALDLHFRRHEDGRGLTPSRLRDLCVEQNICSPTRVSAFLALLQFGGHIEPARVQGDRRIREFIPSKKLINTLCWRWHAQLVPAATVVRDAQRAIDHLHQMDFVHCMVRLLAKHFCAGFRYADHLPALRLFSSRNGGLLVLFSILAADANCDDVERIGKISISQLARNTSTSRAHVIKLLREAENEDLIKRLDNGNIMMAPKLVHDLHEFFAINYLILVHFSNRAIDHLNAVRGASVGACSETS